jgi:hypothetical protein
MHGSTPIQHFCGIKVIFHFMFIFMCVDFDPLKFITIYEFQTYDTFWTHTPCDKHYKLFFYLFQHHDVKCFALVI